MNSTLPPELPSLLGFITLGVFLVAVALVIRPVKFRIRSVPIEIGFVAAPILAVVVLLACTAMTPSVAWDGVRGTGALLPYSIIILFFSLSYVSVSLDETGLLATVSFWFATKAGSSGRRLYVVIFVLSSILTILTSNDVVVMTVTPFVLYTCQYVKVDPLPFLFAEFLAANVWSSILYIGNPTNIIVAQANQVSHVRAFRNRLTLFVVAFLSS